MEYQDPEDFIRDDSFLLYCSGKAPEATARWEQWLADNPGRRQDVMQARELVLYIQAELTDVAAASATFRQRLSPVSDLPAPVFPLWKKMLGVAAGLLLLAGSFGIWRYISTPDWLEVSTPLGAVKKVALPDGTQMWLNGGTTVKYIRKFRQSRQVVLEEGEVFFNVVHRADVPFEVRLPGGLQVQDIGTAFSVKSRQQISDELLLVQEGKVLLKKNEQHIQTLEKNEGISIEKGTMKTTAVKASPVSTSGWLTGTVALDNRSFSELGIALENTFQKRVIINGEQLKNRSITITFSRQDNLQQLLETLKLVYQITYEISGEQVIIK
ncbi:FecR family protein [Chitinophaga solisilvae]|uniref:FecR family protein n=1 Tax=Chitinophaga solisilvae TaxID=1233460 RepID=UPI00136998D3|nr:FecR family protein [Chitinophaga solisilvae]